MLVPANLPAPPDAAKDNQEIILAFLRDVQSEIIDLALSKGMNATGRTLGSLEVIPFNLTGGVLMANENIKFLETGRGPTKPGAPAGNPTLVEAIKEWADAKGLALNPWAVAKSIHKYGTKLYRQGGKSGVLSIPLREERIEELFGKLTEQLTYKAASEIYEPFKNIA